MKDSGPPRMTIQNTLRRILESYFTIWGGMKLHEIAERFNSQERAICGSLLSWVHSGSHIADDDIYFSWDQSMATQQLDIFRRIFDELGHESHYKMMMGLPDDADTEDAAE